MASEVTGDDNFGLWFGNQFLPRDIGMLGYAVVSSHTLRDALLNLENLGRYHQEASLLRMKSLSGGKFAFEYKILKSDINDRRQDAEFSLATFQNIIRECCGSKWTPLEVHFEHPQPKKSNDHMKIFGAPVSFSQPWNALIFDGDILDRKMPVHDVRLLGLMEAALRRVNSDFIQASLIDFLKSCIRGGLVNGYPRIEDAAVEMGVSVSAINAELFAIGTTYNRVVDDVRRSLALSYVSNKLLNLTDISMMLGYSELSAFSRAFRRWNGKSPRSFRA